MNDQTGTTLPARHFTVQSLAAYWGVSPSHIYNLIHSNALRHMRIGKAIRIPTIFIKEYEETSCQTAMTFTVSGNTTMELGTLSGHQKPKRKQTLAGQNAYQRGLQIAEKRNNTAPNLSQD
jgi:excisionase family DNA binding protein